MGVRVEVKTDKDLYAPGDEVRGTVEVLEGGTARTTDVELVCVELTSDYTETLQTIHGGTLHSGDLSTGMSLPFTIQLPPDAWPTVVAAGSITWRVDVDVDRRGFDKGATATIIVGSSPPENLGQPAS